MNRDFKGVWIPKEIWLHPKLSLQAKCLWAEIWTLHSDDHGGCYASDDYLCDFIQLKKRRLYELLKELKDAGFVEDVNFNGRRSIRRAIYPTSAEQVCGKMHSSNAEKRIADMQKTGISPYIENKEENKEEKESSLPPSFPSSKKSKKEVTKFEKKAYRGNVFLTEKEYQQHLQRYGQKKLDWMLDYLEAKVGSKGYEYDSHYHVLLPSNWVNKAYEEGHKNKQNESLSASDEQVTENNKQWFAQTVRKLISPPMEFIGNFSHYVNFHDQAGKNSKDIYFKELNFKDLVINQLKERKYKLKGDII